MGVVVLASGGLDSTLISVMAKEEGVATYPLFIDYGQRAAKIEWETCQTVHKNLKLSQPTRLDVSGFGHLISTGLTDASKHIVTEVFTPGRNLLFLVLGASYAFQVGADSVAIGLLSQEFSLFPDQSEHFIIEAEKVIRIALGKEIKVVAPLSVFSKGSVLELAKARGITGTYSCHAGGDRPCGVCISCKEIINSI